MDLIILCQFSLLLHSDLDVELPSDLAILRDSLSRSTEHHFLLVIIVITA